MALEEELPRAASSSSMIPLVCLLVLASVQGDNSDGEPLVALESARASADFAADSSVGVFVGVNEFLAPDGRPSKAVQNLRFAVDDAIDLAHLFGLELRLVPPARIRLQLSGKPTKEGSVRALQALRGAGAQVGMATRSEIREALRLARIDSSEPGLFAFGYSSHGMSLDGLDVLLAQDSQTHEPDTAISLAWILDQIEQTKAKRRLVLLDACRDSMYRSGGDLAAAMQSTFMRVMKESVGLVVLAGTVANGFSFEDPDLGNGVFTANIIEGLRGKAPGNADGLITAETLASYCDAQVKQWVVKNVPVHAARCTGITMNVEDLRSRGLPLAVNAEDFERARERRGAAGEIRRILCQALDFEVLRGEHAQAIHAALKVPSARADEIAARVRGLRDANPEGVRAFVTWWETQPEWVPAAAPRSIGTIPRFGLEPYDNADTDKNDDLARASRVSCRAALAGQVGGAADPRDIFVFTPETNGLFVYSVQNTENSTNRTGALDAVRLLDSAQRSLYELHHSAVGPGKGGASNPVSLSAGKPYYIALSAPEKNAASYSLSFVLTPLEAEDSLEPNDTPRRDLRALDLGQGVRATVGFGKDQQDWYRIEAPGHGRLALAVSNEHVDGEARQGALAAVQILDSNQRPLASIHHSVLGPGRGGSSLPIAVSKGAQYFIAVAPAGEGQCAPYRIDASFDPYTISDQPQRNDALQTAISIRENETLLSIVGFGDDPVDFYRFDADTSATLELSLRNLHQSADVQNGALSAVRVLDRDGAELVQIHHSTLGPARDGTVQFKALQGNAYYVRVEPADSRHAVPYQLSLRGP